MAHGCGCLYLLLILNLFEATIAASQIKLSENGSVEPDETYDGKVRPTGDGRYEAYMIPPFKSNHASFIELLPNGDLVLAWFSGTAEGESDVAIVLSRLPNGTDQWSRAAVLSQRKDYSNQNPVLFYDAKGKMLHLYHTQQPTSVTDGIHLPEYKATIWTLNSTDLGNKWSLPWEMFHKDGSYDRNRILLTLNGDWILPMYYSLKDIQNQYSAVQITANGLSWEEYEMKGSNYLVQPSVVRPLPNNRTLMSFFRDKRAEHIYQAVSSDDGGTWSKPEPTKFPNNDAAIQARVLMNQHVVLVYNPTTHDRHPIRISLSEDGGKTWPHYRDLETGSGPEYSYPCILQTSDGYIHVTYTYNRETIKYVKFMEDWIKGK